MSRSTQFQVMDDESNSDNDLNGQPAIEDDGTTTEEDSNEDDDDDEEATAPDETFDDPGFWPPEALAILQEHKEKWVEGDRGDGRVRKAVDELKEGGHGKRPDIKKAVQKWLQRRATTVSKYEPGHAPTIRGMVNWYESDKIARDVEKMFKADATLTKKDRIGIHAKMLSQHVKQLLCEPDKRRLYELEEKRKDWMKRGPPRQLQRKQVERLSFGMMLILILCFRNAEKKLLAMIWEFIIKVYWHTGARLSIHAAFRGIDGDVVAGV